jgi:hypothetical protein
LGLDALDLASKVLHGLNQDTDQIAIGNREQSIIVGEHRLRDDGRQLLGDNANTAQPSVISGKGDPTQVLSV